MKLWRWLAPDVGIDLGTANTLVYTQNKGVTAQEPSVVAVDGQKKVLAVGNTAKQMLGRTPGHITACRPLRYGVIADFDLTVDMLRHFLNPRPGRRRLLRPHCMIGVPSGVTGVERRAIQDAALQAGAQEVQVLEEPLLAAIGAGLPVKEPVGSMVVDIGGGTTDVAVVSLGGIVTSRSLRVAGDEIDEAIIQWVRRRHNLLIGPRTAEAVKIAIGSAYEPETGAIAHACGRDLYNGMPRVVTLTAEEVHTALAKSTRAIVTCARQTLENAPPELAADIVDRGIWLTGGGALLRGLDRLMAAETGMTVHLAEDPLLCVVKGTARVMEDASLRPKSPHIA